MTIGNVRCMAICIAIIAMLATPGWTTAHPHLLIEGHEEIIFDAEQRITAIRNIWTFDAEFSVVAAKGYDVDGDGKLTRTELAPLAKINVTSLKDFGYFTSLTIGGQRVDFSLPTYYFLTEKEGRLTLNFTLPLAQPMKVTGEVVLEIFDPEYFVAFRFHHEAGALINAPKKCSVEYRQPPIPDGAVIARLAAVPLDQRELPPDLRKAVAIYASRFVGKCSK